jgi:uncharacterized protein
MNQAVFADTFYYLALVNPRDAAHERAVAVGNRISGSVLTSAWVIQELADGLAAPPARSGFLRLLAALESDRHTTIVGPTEELWKRGVHLYRSRPDKGWSLTDCISFEIMQDNGITDALTGDHHFAQAGFKALLK